MKASRFIAAMACTALLAACGGNAAKEKAAEEKEAAQKEFAMSQPMATGQYRAVSYDIAGANPRKGKFDGRLLASLAPEQSVMYVYENGNRTKIAYKVILKSPFEKGDSGVYRAVDSNDLPVTVSTDSTVYTLRFDKGQSKIAIGFESNPMSTGTPVEILERISAQIQKNK